MKKISKIFTLVIAFTVVFSVSGVTVYAQDNFQQQQGSGTNTQQGGGNNNQQGGGFQVQQGAPDNSIKLVNPLGGNDGVRSLPELVESLLRIVLTVGTPLVALAIIYTGFQFIAAQGNPEALSKARKSLVVVIIGAAILLGAYVIAEAIVGTINAVRGN